jgi:putative ABC transport system ATP-binding protein
MGATGGDVLAPSVASREAPLSLVGVRATVPDGDDVRVLLDDVDLTVAAGEIVAVTGPSGSGKSTLLSLAGLLRRPMSGEVLIGGRPTAVARERDRAKIRGRHIGIVYQSANLLPSLTAREQLQLVGRLTRISRPETDRRADRLLDQLGLGPHATRLPAQLSGGERQRVGIARALMADPTVLLADEPTASLDPDLAAGVAELLRTQVTTRELACVVVTHDAAPVDIADRHLCLAGGALAEAVPMAS